MHSAEIPATLQSSIQNEHRKIDASGKKLRYHELSGVHNPWGRAAKIFDSWKLLEVCQAPCLLKLVTEMIGDDIILWDSRFFSLADFVPKSTWIRESDFSPFEDLQGVTVRIPITMSGQSIEVKSSQNSSDGPESLLLRPGYASCHDAHLPYRYKHTKNIAHQGEFVIQYASGHSRYVREQSSTVQRCLTERLPLINFAEMPIWLLQGVDHVNNDFATGFAPTIAQWTDAKW
jgi:hypothetical protein